MRVLYSLANLIKNKTTRLKVKRLIEWLFGNVEYSPYGIATIDMELVTNDPKVIATSKKIQVIWVDERLKRRKND
jgi:hypothetical protein